MLALYYNSHSVLVSVRIPRVRPGDRKGPLRDQGPRDHPELVHVAEGQLRSDAPPRPTVREGRRGGANDAVRAEDQKDSREADRVADRDEVLPGRLRQAPRLPGLHDVPLRVQTLIEDRRLMEEEEEESPPPKKENI